MNENKSKQRDRPGHLAAGLLVGGAAAMAVGIGLIYLPAGLIAAGLLAIIGGVLEALGGGDAT